MTIVFKHVEDLFQDVEEIGFQNVKDLESGTDGGAMWPQEEVVVPLS